MKTIERIIAFLDYTITIVVFLALILASAIYYAIKYGVLMKHSARYKDRGKKK